MGLLKACHLNFAPRVPFLKWYEIFIFHRIKTIDPRFLYPFSEAEFSARPSSIRESMNNLASVDSPSAKQSGKKDRCIDTGDGIDVAFQKKELFYVAHKPLRTLLLDWCSFPCVPWDNTMRSIVSPEIVKHEKLAQLQGTWKKKLLVDESLLKDRRILAPHCHFLSSPFLYLPFSAYSIANNLSKYYDQDLFIQQRARSLNWIISSSLSYHTWNQTWSMLVRFGKAQSMFQFQTSRVTASHLIWSVASEIVYRLISGSKSNHRG